MNIKRYLLLFSAIFMVAVYPQSIRSLVNDGVDKYENKKYADSEIDFRKGLEVENDNFESHFNLGSALYKQGRYDDALKSYQNSLQFSRNREEKAKIFHNIGNALLKSDKLKESVQAYKNALKLNPNDSETKYNLSYALNKMKQQQNQKDKNKDKNKDQDKEKDQNKDQDQKDQQQNQDQNKDKQDQQQNKNDKQDQDQQQQQQEQEQQPQEEKVSKEEAERILNALKNNEADLQKELRKRQGRVLKREKDW